MDKEFHCIMLSFHCHTYALYFLCQNRIILQNLNQLVGLYYFEEAVEGNYSANKVQVLSLQRVAVSSNDIPFADSHSHIWDIM